LLFKLLKRIINQTLLLTGNFIIYSRTHSLVS